MSKTEVVLDTHIGFWMVIHDWRRFPTAWRNEIELADQVGHLEVIFHLNSIQIHFNPIKTYALQNPND